MRATAIVEVERRDGRTVCSRLRSDPPLTVRRTGDGVVHLVGSGAGPIGGDELVLELRVGPGASLVLRSVAAAVVLPGPSAGTSQLTIDADIAPGGSLDLALQPQIVARDADHRNALTVRMAASARFQLREVTVLGRHDEPGGSVLNRLRVDRDEQPLIRSDLAVGPRWPDSQGPAGVGPARWVGSGLVVEPSPDVPAADSWEPISEAADRFGVFDLSPGVRLTTAIGYQGWAATRSAASGSRVDMSSSSSAGSRAS